MRYIILFYITIALYAQESFIDKQHKFLSDNIRSFGKSLDEGASYLFDQSDTNSTELDTSLEVDSFFQNKKYTDETRKAYLHFRFNNLISSQSSHDNSIGVNAQIPLSIIKKINLFINDTKDNYLDTLSSDNTEDDSLAVGINYFTSKTDDIQSKYSLGVRSTALFAKARYNLVYQLSSWKIEPTQEFQYSTKNRFAEETNLYFDKALDDLSLFRINLYRGSQEKNRGMDYGTNISYYHIDSETKGYSLTQSFHGNTKYIYTQNNTLETQKSYNKIYEYATLFKWRQNILREWILYEIQPILSFHKKYEYKPNYILQFNLEFYFGGKY